MVLNTFGNCTGPGAIFETLDMIDNILGYSAKPAEDGIISDIGFYLTIKGTPGAWCKVKYALYSYVGLGDAGTLLCETEEYSKSFNIFVTTKGFLYLPIAEDPHKLTKDTYYYLCAWGDASAATVLTAYRNRFSHLTNRSFEKALAYDDWPATMTGETGKQWSQYACGKYKPSTTVSGYGRVTWTP